MNGAAHCRSLHETDTSKRSCHSLGVAAHVLPGEGYSSPQTAALFLSLVNFRDRNTGVRPARNHFSCLSESNPGPNSIQLLVRRGLSQPVMELLEAAQILDSSLTNVSHLIAVRRSR